jgi:DNA (cytosine-5)-methyltransferase 1
MPCLTVSMAATLQGFPEDWRIAGLKTHAYRQVGNAFPPPVAKAIGMRIAAAVKAARKAASAEQEAAAA